MPPDPRTARSAQQWPLWRVLGDSGTRRRIAHRNRSEVIRAEDKEAHAVERAPLHRAAFPMRRLPPKGWAFVFSCLCSLAGTLHFREIEKPPVRFVTWNELSPLCK
jgi:hypothetical protein